MNDVIKYYSKNNLLTKLKCKDVEELYTLDKSQLLERYNSSFLKLLKNTWNRSSFYKKLYADHGIQLKDIKDISDIKKLPIITKMDIRDHVNDIYHGSNFLKSVGYTSGTTGSPLVLYRTPKNVITEQAYILHYRSLNGYKLGEPLLAIRGMLDKNTTHHYNKKSNILYLSSPNINANTIEFYYDLIQKFAPVAVEAFPSYLHKLCIELEKKNLKIQIPNSFTSSETLYGFQRDAVEKYLGTKIHDWYGNAERTILLAQNNIDEYYPLPLYSINEFGENEIITTNLTNEKFPFIRYMVEDKIVVEGNDFYENLVSPKIKQIEGRISETIDLKDGSVVGCIDHAFKGIDHLDCAQVHQFDVNKPLEIQLVILPGFGDKEINKISAKLQNMLGKDMPFEFKYASRDELTYTATNKFRLLVKHNA